MKDKTMGQVAYEAYCESVDWKSFDGHPLPPWRDVIPRIQEAWEASAQAVLR